MWQPTVAGKKRNKLRRRLLACISPARAAALKAAERAAGAVAAVDPVERYPVPHTLAVSAVDKLTLELDFCSEDIAGGELTHLALISATLSLL